MDRRAGAKSRKAKARRPQRRGVRFARIDLSGFGWVRLDYTPEVGNAERSEGTPVRSAQLQRVLRLTEPDFEQEYMPDGRAVGRAMLRMELEEPDLQGFVRRFGPLTRTRVVDVQESLRSIGRLQTVAQEWANAYRSMRHFVPADGTSRKLTDSELARNHVMPLFNEYAKAHVRLSIEFAPDGNPELVAKPADLMGFVWLTLAELILRGEHTGHCRSLKCKNMVDRSPSDKNSMRRLYCAESRDKCARSVFLNKSDDRWPELRGKKSPAQREAILKRIFSGELQEERQ